MPVAVRAIGFGPLTGAGRQGPCIPTPSPRARDPGATARDVTSRPTRSAWCWCCTAGRAGVTGCRSARPSCRWCGWCRSRAGWRGPAAAGWPSYGCSTRCAAGTPTTRPWTTPGGRWTGWPSGSGRRSPPAWSATPSGAARRCSRRPGRRCAAWWRSRRGSTRPTAGTTWTAAGCWSSTAPTTGSPTRRGPGPSPATWPGPRGSATCRWPAAATRCCATTRRFDRYAAQFAAATLLDETAAGPVGEVLAGQAWVDA